MGRKAGLPVIYRRDDSEFWWCRFSLDGRRYMQSTGETDAGKAETAAQVIYAEVRLGRPAPSQKRLSFHAATSLEQLSAEFLVWAQTNKSKGYSQRIEGQLRMFTGRWRRLHEATTVAEIEKFKFDRLKVDGVTTITLHKDLVVLSQFFKWCKRVKKVLRELPDFERIKPVSDYVPPNYSRADIDKILAELPDRHTHQTRNAVREFFTVQWAQGMRPGQVAELRWEDVDLDGRQIYIRQTNDKARNAGRFIAMDEIAHRVLSDLAKDPHLHTSRVFGWHNYRISIERAIERINKRMEEEQGPNAKKLRMLTPHHFRHARLTELASVTRDTAAIQALAGHKSLATTDRYVRSRVERQASVLALAAEAAEKAAFTGPRRSPRSSSVRRYR
jgi:integrase